jgi:hypothetical protein
MILFWPLTALRFGTYRRRYHAALIVFLGQQTFEKLAPQDRIRVDADVDENWRGTDTPVVAHRKLIPPDLLSADRAAAMDRLGIPPCVAALTWKELFEPWRYWRRISWASGRRVDDRADCVIMDYRIYHPANDDARKFLREQGVLVESAPAPYASSDN